MDWKQLQRQKLTLINISQYSKLSLLCDDILGVIHILDAVQDCAVDELGIAEDVVFELLEKVDYGSDVDEKVCPICGCTLKTVIDEGVGKSLYEHVVCPDKHCIYND